MTIQRFDLIYSLALSAGGFMPFTALAAQETPMLSETNPLLSSLEPPAASLEDVTWLVGDWEGKDSEGDRVIERWLPPIGKLMVGTFIQTVRTDEGELGVESTEHMHLWEAGGTLHFASMSIELGFEPYVGSRKLVAIKPCAVHFEYMSMRCSDPEQPGTGLIVAYDLNLPGEPQQEYVITYEKAGENQSHPPLKASKKWP